MIRRALYGQVVYPLYHGLRRDGLMAAIRSLEATQWAAPAELAALQGERLERLLRFAAAHVPYYRSVFRRLGVKTPPLAEPERFRQLPILSKDLIRREARRLHAAPDSGRRGFPNSTSGSTGEPLRFLTDVRAHALRLADELRGKTWTGFRLGDRQVALWGAPMDIRRAQKWRGRLHGFITGHRLLSSYELSADAVRAHLRAIERFRPRVMVGYPSALEAVAEYCLERGGGLEGLEGGIITSAETLWDHQRSLFQSAFGRPIFNRYGSREFGAIAHECPQHGGLHVSADRLLLEIVDGHGRPCPPGDWGELLITDLESYAMPLIRYRIGDRARWASGRACACGRGLPLLAEIEGRSMDAVYGPEGQRVGGTFWTLLLRSRPGLRQFQVVQAASGEITIRFVPESRLAPAALDHFSDRIRQRLGKSVAVRFEEVERVPATASGKQRLVISEFRRDGSGGAPCSP